MTDYSPSEKVLITRGTLGQAHLEVDRGQVRVVANPSGAHVLAAKCVFLVAHGTPMSAYPAVGFASNRPHGW